MANNTSTLQVQFTPATAPDGALAWQTVELVISVRSGTRNVGLLLRHRKLRSGERIETAALNGTLYKQHLMEFEREELVSLSGSDSVSTKYPVWELLEATPATPLVTINEDGGFAAATGVSISFDAEAGGLRCSQSVWGSFRVRYRSGGTYYTWAQDRVNPEVYGIYAGIVYLEGHVFARLGRSTAVFEIDGPNIQGDESKGNKEAYKVLSYYLSGPPDHEIGRPPAVELPPGFSPPDKITYPGLPATKTPDPDVFLQIERVHELATVREAAASVPQVFRWERLWPYSTDTSYHPAYFASWSSDPEVWERVDRAQVEEYLLSRYPGIKL